MISCRHFIHFIKSFLRITYSETWYKPILTFFLGSVSRESPKVLVLRKSETRYNVMLGPVYNDVK